MASKGTVGLIGAGLGALAGAAIVFGIFGSTGEDTNIILGTSNSSDPCVVVSKENVLQRKAGKKVKWWVRDFTCKNTAEVVTIGNFRTTAQSSYTNCENATEGGTQWPFVESADLQNRRANPGGKIDLKLKGASDLQPQYYFDVCTGTGAAQKKSDPLLVIDP